MVGDILTKNNFIRGEWNHLLFLFNIHNISVCISPFYFSSTSTSQTMSKMRIQQDRPGEDARVCCGIQTYVEFCVEDCRSVSDSAGFECISQPRDTQSLKAKSSNSDPISTGKPFCKPAQGDVWRKLSKNTHWYKIVSPQLDDILEQCWSS